MNININEMQIAVPWGHLAAKIWGNQNDPMILVFHGIMDNAGSFDRLIPLLPQAFCYVCFDLPGHGKSSHFPPYFPIYTLNYVIVYKLIAQHFGKEKYIILGHSYGGQIGFFFAQLYPEYVEKLIMLDTVHTFPVPARQFGENLREKFNFTIELHEKMTKRKPPQYTYREALDKLVNQRWNGGLTEEAAEALLPRALEPADDGKYSFTTDQRLKMFLNPVHDFRYIEETIQKFPVTCPVLMVLGRASEMQQMVMASVIKLLKKNKRVTIRYAEGAHDVHNVSPQLVAPYVSKFLLAKKNKL